MLIQPQRARDLKVQLFEEETQADLEESLQTFLEDLEEAVLVGLSFEADATSYRAHVLYTE